MSKKIKFLLSLALIAMTSFCVAACSFFNKSSSSSSSSSVPQASAPNEDSSSGNNPNDSNSSSGPGVHVHAWQVKTVLQERTCEQDGLAVVTCTCGLEETQIQPTPGHAWGEPTPEKKPTCYNAGENKRTCGTCGESITELVEKLNHNYTLIEETATQLTYRCGYCYDYQTIAAEDNILEVTEDTYLFDQDNSFSFLIQSNQDADYIKNNLSIINAYFENTEYEGEADAVVDYTVTSVSEGVWEIAANAPYHPGDTYVAKTRNLVAFKDYGGKNLYFSIHKEDTAIVKEKEGSNIVYVQTLESQSPGYYPYEVEISENANTLWVTLGKTTSLSVGNIICVGTAQSLEEVMTNTAETNYIGKIESIHTLETGNYLLSLSAPDFEEIFEELDLSTNQDINFEDENVQIPDDFQEQAIAAFTQSDDYAEFLGASSAAAEQYLKTRQLATAHAQPAAFKDQVQIKVNNLVLNGTTITVEILGSLNVPIKTKSGTKLGDINISFTTKLKAGISVDANVVWKKYIGWITGKEYITGLRSFDVSVTQTNTIDFTFDVKIDVDYELTDESIFRHQYVLNPTSGVYHFTRCKHVQQIKDKSKLKGLSIEQLPYYHDNNLYKQCGTCKPYDALMATTYIVHKTQKTVHTFDCSSVDTMNEENVTFSISSWQTLQKQGNTMCGNCHPESREVRQFQSVMWDAVKRGEIQSYADQIKQWTQKDGKSDEKSVSIFLSHVPIEVFGFEISVDVRFVFNFDFEVSMSYEYKNTQTITNGLRYTGNGFQTYSTKTQKEEENKIDMLGSMQVKVGVAADVTVSVAGLSWLANVGIGAEGGVYIDAKGALQADFAEDEYYAAARLETGLYVDVYGTYAFFGISDKSKWVEEKFPLYTWGVDKAYISFVDTPEEIYWFIDEEYTLGNSEFLSVKYFDVASLTEKTETLNQKETNLYQVQFTLENGTYCRVENGKLVLKDNATTEFTDTLYVTVIGNTDMQRYKKGNAAFFLDTYAVTIHYSPIITCFYELVDSKDPSCTTDGWLYYVCQDCGKEKTEYLLAPGHTHVVDPYLAPTCETDGHTENDYCSVCGEVFATATTLPAYGHNLKTIPAQAPTCGAIGWDKYFACWNDGCDYTTYVELPATGNHTFTDWTIDEHYHWHLCTVCEDSIDKQAHTANENNVCTICQKDVPSVGVIYGIAEDGLHAAVIGYNGTATHVNIGTTYLGLPVKEIVQNAFYDCSSLTSVVIPGSVTSIGEDAFYFCTSLTSVVIPDSVTSIGYHAFFGCNNLQCNVYNNVKYLGNDNNPYVACVKPVSTNLSAVTLHEACKVIASSAFEYCRSLTSVVIPDSVTSIDENAFYGCRSLTSVVIPDSVTSIGDGAFYNCISLTSVYITDITAWYNISFADYASDPLYYAKNLYLNGELVTELVIPDSVTTIGNYAFYNCTSLTSVEIPDSVTSVGYHAFYGCPIKYATIPALAIEAIQNGQLQEVVITSGNLVDDYAFAGCMSLTNVVIPDSVTWIGYHAFSGCTSLTSVVIPDSVTSIYAEAFRGCDNLQYNVYENAKYLGNESNPYLACIKPVSADISILTIHKACKVIAGNAFYWCNSLTNVVIPDSVTLITGGAFWYCSSLTSVVIPDSVISIDDVFYECTSLTSVVIPDSVTSIGGNAFYNCRSLTSVVIPDSVTSIGDQAFYNCTSLTSVVIPDSVTSIGGGAFSGCDNLQYNVYENVKYLGNKNNPYLACIEPVSVDISILTIHEDCKVIVDCQLNFYHLTNINISGNNETYQSIDGNLYSKDGTTLIKYAGGKKANSFTIPDSVTSIGAYAFHDCNNLTSVEIGDSVTSIGDYAFYGCDSLTSVVIPNSVTSIGEEAFSWCTSLTSITVSENNANYKSIDGNLYSKDGKTLMQYTVGKTATSFTIPDSVTTIGNYAFSGCDSLTSVEIPDSVTSIGNYAFSGCDSLTSIEIPDSVTSIGYLVFYDCLKLRSIVIGNGVTSIYYDTFYYCTGLTSVRIGLTVTWIYDDAFAGCDNLKSITIPNNVTVIGDYAFSECDSLTSVKIGDSVTWIGDYAFSFCTSLTSITFNGTVEEWNAIPKGDNWNVDVPATKVVCKDGSVKI